MRRHPVVAVVLGIVLAFSLAFFLVFLLRPAVALACGAYVARAREDVATFNDAIEFAVLREGTTTFVTVRNAYRGPAEEFAIVVPVPSLLGPDDVTTLDPAIFELLQRMTGPVIMYERERDPCAKDEPGGASGSSAPAGTGGVTGAGMGSDPPPVVVEAAFHAGEYDVVVLSATQSAALGRWLTDNGYKMPPGLPPLLAPYVSAGWKFFVAKVDPARVTFLGGRAALSPLRFRYDAADLTIPVRLATLNSAGQQDVRIYVFGDKATEVANRPNVDIPRGATLNERGRDNFVAFYQTLFERTLAKHPDAVVTEYVGDLASYQARELTGPLGAANGGAFTLTRLHLRVRKGGNVDDLVLRAVDRTVYRAGYVYRTPWRGPALCASPRRDVWDKEYEGAGAASGWSSAWMDPGDGPTDALPRLEDLVTSPIDELGVKPGGAAAPSPSGCGCGAGGGASGAGALAMIVLALCNVRRRRDLSLHVDR
ncbi:MAG TPA: DUF2330 domain-containing protein [Kofleriaceae bacterium]|nr:DUF2330 domain-containing protein [Kofleriaceae bacterium]